MMAINSRSSRVPLLLVLVLAVVTSASTHVSAQQAASAVTYESAVQDLVVANRVLANQQVLDAFGHVSVRDPRDPTHFLMSRNLAPALVTAPDIITYDFDGNAIGAPPNTSHFLERFIHGEMYRARKDVNAVVHSHSPAVIPFSVTKVPMQPLYHMSSFLAAGVPVFEIRSVGGETNMLISNGKLGKSLSDTLADKSVALLRGHGDVVVASSLPMVVFRAVYTETNARLQSQAMGIGGPITFLDKEEGAKAMEVLEQIHTRAWDLWKRDALAQMKTP